jgi:mannose-6-phosphate isomerase-like protein (cupin superfamily)
MPQTLETLIMKTLILLIGSALVVGCTSTSPKIHLADGSVVQDLEWEPWERAKDVAVQPLWNDRASTHSLVRLAVSEKPHVHDSHDLTVFVLKGRVRVHLGDRSVELGPGDIIQIPHGLRHWAQNIHPSASEAYVVFSPHYKGEDKRLVK